MKKYFPHAWRAQKGLGGLIVAILINVVIGILGGLLIGLLGAIPVIKILAPICGWLLEIYGVVGLVLSILVFLKVVK